MSKLTYIPFITLLTREISRFIKVLFQTLVTPIIANLLYLMVFGVSLGDQIAPIQGLSYFAFIIPGLVMMSIIRNAFDNSSGSIITSKFCGEFEDYKALPLSVSQIAWALSIAGLVRGFLVGMVVYVTSVVLFYWNTSQVLHLSNMTLFIFFSAISGLAFGHLGIFVTLYANTFEKVSSINTFILLPLTYLGGVFFSLEHIHPFWQVVSQYNPLLYLVNGMRYSIVGVSDVPVDLSAYISVLMLVIFYVLSHWGLKNGSYQRW